MDPLQGTVLSKVYTVEAETQKIDYVTDYFWQNDGIGQAEHKSITENVENVKKTKLFHDFIVNANRKEFGCFLSAIQKFRKDTSHYKRYGKAFITGILEDFLLKQRIFPVDIF